MILIRRPWTRQPQQQAALSTRLIRAVAAWTGAHPQIGLDGFSWTRSSSLTNAVEVPGRIVNFVGSTTNAFTRSGISTSAQTRYFGLAVFRWASGASNNFPQLMGLSTANSGFRIGSSETGSIGSTTGIGLVKGSVVVLPTITITSDIWYALVASHRQDTGKYYMAVKSLDGGTVIRTTATNTLASTAGNGNAGVGISRTDFSGAWNGGIALAVQAFDWVEEAVARKFLDNPWAIFEDLVYPVPTAVSGLPTLTALTASNITTSGWRATLTSA